jgi:hypothetical protein
MIFTAGYGPAGVVEIIGGDRLPVPVWDEAHRCD